MLVEILVIPLVIACNPGMAIFSTMAMYQMFRSRR